MLPGSGQAADGLLTRNHVYGTLFITTNISGKGAFVNPHSRPRPFRPNRQVMFLSVFGLLLLFTAAKAYAAVSGEMVWNARYNSGGAQEDSAHSIAIGPKGSIYVSGSGGDDFVTVKYSGSGASQWVRRYNGTGNGDDRLDGMAVDAKGNVYITGTSPGAGSGEDFVTIKYGNGGGLKWVRRFNGRANGDDEATAIAAGSTGVYVTGQSQGLKTGLDFATIKYGFDGRVEWVKRYNSAGNGADMAAAVAVDRSDNVCVAGTSAGDFATVKYSATGQRSWVARYGSPGGHTDSAVELAVDSSGSVFTVGLSETGAAAGAIALVKYDGAGGEQWVRRYDGPVTAQDWPADLALDPLGNVYVAGASSNDFAGVLPFDPVDFLTIKYSGDGVQQWVRTKTDFDSASALAVDGSGNVFVTGQAGVSLSAESVDYATLKYSTEGTLQWAKTFSGRGSNMDYATDIAVDASGAAYTTGAAYRRRTGTDFTTVKYAP